MAGNTNNTPIPDAELAEVKRLHAAATPGEWRYDGMHNEIVTPNSMDQYWLIISECRSAPDQAQKEEFGHGFDANFASIAALHNAFPAILARLEAAERERDTATDDEAGHWIRIIRSLDPENLCDVFDGLGCEQKLRQWLAARDAQQRREGAAEVWDQIAKITAHVTDGFIRVSRGYAEEQAESLREGGE